MSWAIIVAELRAFPWVALAFQAETVVIAFMIWQLTKHWYAKEWLRYASEKARDVVAEARRRLAEAEREHRRLEAEVAELRGMVEGAKARLTKPRQLELVERVAGRGR